MLLQADVLLELHDLGDRLVLDLAQLLGRDLALGLLLARFEQVLGAQEAADVVGAERRRARAGPAHGGLWKGWGRTIIGRGRRCGSNPYGPEPRSWWRQIDAFPTRRRDAPEALMNTNASRPMSKRLAAPAALACRLRHGACLAADAEPFKIGLILPMTGQSASTGRQIEAAVKLYMAQNGNTVAGKKSS